MDLELLLRELCHDDDGERTTDLDQHLGRVRDAQKGVWDQIYLHWFTDHTSEGHSRRLIQLLADTLKQGFSEDEARRFLSRTELFVLLAACYLHDIGMQDSRIDGHFVDANASTEWNRVRKRHPRRSRELIIDHTVAVRRDSIKIGLPDDSQFLDPIAIVAEAHGSEYFDDAVLELRGLGIFPENLPFRGAGLAALLLAIDELDLHKIRVEHLWSKVSLASLSPVGHVHYHLHHYVERVELIKGLTRRHRRVKIDMRVPADGVQYADQLRVWLGRRLVRQLRRANSVLLEEFDGEVLFDDYVVINQLPVEAQTVRRLSIEGQREIDRLLLGEGLIDRDALRDELLDALDERRQSARVIEVLSSDGSDWPELLKWLSVEAETRDLALVHVAFDDYRVGHDLRDVGLRIAAQRPSLQARASAGASITEGFTEELRAGEAVLVVEAFEQADRRVQEWLVSLAEIVQSADAGVVIAEGGSTLGLPDARRFALTPFTRAEIADALVAQLGFSANMSDGPYAAGPVADGIHAMTAGRPIDVQLQVRRMLAEQLWGTSASEAMQ